MYAALPGRVWRGTRLAGAAVWRASGDDGIWCNAYTYFIDHCSRVRRAYARECQVHHFHEQHCGTETNDPELADGEAMMCQTHRAVEGELVERRRRHHLEEAKVWEGIQC